MKTALVTGASTGIGRETAIALGNIGYTTILTARSLERLKETQRSVKSESSIIQADLTNLDDIKNLSKEIIKSHKQLNLLVNVAGIWHNSEVAYADTPLEDFSEETIVNTFFVGLVAPVLLTKYLLPIMPKGSAIVNLSGTFENGGRGWLPYFTSKRGLEDFTVGLSQELRDKEIAVNCVSPSDVATESYQKFFPQCIDEAVDPKVVADCIAQLAKRTETTGKTFVVKKGQELFEAFHY